MTDHLIDIGAVKQYLLNLQDQICSALETIDGHASFAEDNWQRPEGGGGRTRVLRHGQIIEKGGVNFSHIFGQAMPASATAARPALAGRSYQAMGVSLVIHPDNPYIPTSHANVRFFMAEKPGAEPVWWFGGGFDLTPYYPDEADVIHWHETAKAACDPFGAEVYPRLKQWCDDYFYLKHRHETRGVGGLFFDDWSEPDFDGAFALMQSVGNAFLPAYLPIMERQQHRAFSAHEKQFQRYRRGRYVEFNLVLDRGTLFGLQSNGRVESILMSLPPDAGWEYAWQPEPGSAEAELYARYLQPQDWLMLNQH